MQTYKNYALSYKRPCVICAQNETYICINSEKFILEHAPVVPGSLLGTIYLNDKPSQFFVFHEPGYCQLKDCVNPDPNRPVVFQGNLNHTTGEVTFKWTTLPKEAKFIYCYDYTMEFKHKI